MTSFWGELKRRNVVRVAIAYAVVAWLSIEVSATTFPMLKLPEWAATLVTVLLMIGFPVALIFAWAFELTPEGLKKEKDVDRSESITHITGRKLDFVIIGVLVVAVGFLLVDKIYLSDGDTAPDEIITTERKSIAVLPFVNMSDDPGNEYFSDGISEEILNLLVKVPELRVTSRSSAFSFKGQNVDMPTMAAKLNVAHVLEGSVRKSGNQLRITAQLIEVVTDTHLWSETYDRELESVFAIQDEIAAAVVDALKITLLGHEAEKLAAASTDPEAFEAYLLGKHLLANDSTEAGVRSAAEQFERAVSIDPDYAPAWAGRSLAVREFAYVTSLPYGQIYREARAYAERAIELDPDLDIAYRALGIISLDQFEFAAAKQNFERALSIGPGNAENIYGYAYLMLHMGRVDAAASRYQESLELDPLSIPTLFRHALIQLDVDNLADAEAALARIETINSGYARLPFLRTVFAMRRGEFSVAIEHAKQIPESRGYLKYMYLAWAHSKLGEQELADRYLKLLIDRYGATAGKQIATVYAQRGEPDGAFEWLDRGWEARDPGVMEINFSGGVEPLKEDPRFDAFLEKIGLKAIMTAD